MPPPEIRIAVGEPCAGAFQVQLPAADVERSRDVALDGLGVGRRRFGGACAARRARGRRGARAAASAPPARLCRPPRAEWRWARSLPCSRHSPFSCRPRRWCRGWLVGVETAQNRIIRTIKVPPSGGGEAAAEVGRAAASPSLRVAGRGGRAPREPVRPVGCALPRRARSDEGPPAPPGEGPVDKRAGEPVEYRSCSSRAGLEGAGRPRSRIAQTVSTHSARGRRSRSSAIMATTVPSLVATLEVGLASLRRPCRKIERSGFAQRRVYRSGSLLGWRRSAPRSSQPAASCPAPGDGGDARALGDQHILVVAGHDQFDDPLQQIRLGPAGLETHCISRPRLPVGDVGHGRAPVALRRRKSRCAGAASTWCQVPPLVLGQLRALVAS